MMSNSELWNWTSPAWFVALAILSAYLFAFRGAQRRRVWVLAIGLALFVLAFVSPLGNLSDGYLFSAHMVQHLLMLLVVPLCFMLSLPAQKSKARFTSTLHNGGVPWLPLVIAAWVGGVGAMWFWHVPTLCSASTQSQSLGAVRDTSFIVAGMAFWLPIYAPVQQFRLPPLSGILYLFTACLGCTLLGIYITFTSITVCPAFANNVDRLGIMNGLHEMGLTPTVDQNLGGLLMWVPPCTLYVAAIISLLCRWYTTEEEASRVVGINKPYYETNAETETKVAT